MAMASRDGKRRDARGVDPPGGLAPASDLVGYEVAVVALVALAVYASTRSAVPALTHDALAYLLGIERGGAHLYHPHHLAYGPVAAVWLDALVGLDLAGDSLDEHLSAVALFNSVAGACAASLVYALLRNRAGLPRRPAAAGTLGAGLSFGLWFYSGNVEVYVLPMVFLLAALYVVTAPELTGRHILAVGVLHGLAVLGHQVHVLFVAVVVVALAGRGMATRRHLLGYIGATAAVVATAYGLVLGLVVRPRSAGSAMDWFTSYAQADAYWYRPGPSTVPAAAFGLGRSVLGGHFLFRIDAVADRVTDAFPGKSLSDEAFLVRGLGYPLSVGLSGVAGVAAALLGIVLVRGLRDRRRLPLAAGRLVAPLVAWLAAYAAFFLVWEPWNAEFWIPQATALWLLLAVLCAAPASTGGPAPSRHMGRAPARTGTLLLAAAGLVAVVNLVGSILPATDEANDVYARQYGALAQVIGRGDAVVVDRPHLGVGYTRRFTEATPIPASPFATAVDPDRPAHGFSPRRVVARTDRTLAAGHVVAIAPELLAAPATDEAAETGEALERRYGSSWRPVETASGVDWLVVDGQAAAAQRTRGG